MPIYLKLGDIKGDATQKDHVKWMDIQSIQWYIARNIRTVAGSTANRESSEPSISELKITKLSDSSTAKLVQEVCTGAAGKTVIIHLVMTGNPGKTYIEWTLTNTLISNYSIITSGDRPLESISLNFTQVEMKYTPYDDQNMSKSPISASYDLTIGKST